MEFNIIIALIVLTVIIGIGCVIGTNAAEKSQEVVGYGDQEIYDAQMEKVEMEEDSYESN